MDILKEAKHPNIVHFKAAEVVEDDLVMYLEYLSEGNHMNFLGLLGSLEKVYQKEGRLPEDIIRIYSY